MPAIRATTVITAAVNSQRTSAASAYPSTIPDRCGAETSSRRATPVSNFESNAFYISTHVGASLVVPLPLALSLDSGVDHRWNDYRTDASELGVPRRDRILGWRAGLRRSLKGMTGVAVSYRRERRHSNLDRFDNTTDGLMVQLDINVPAVVGRR